MLRSMATSSGSTATPVVGIVGGGQLARMMYQAAIPLGLRPRIMAEHADDAAALVAADVTIGSPTSASDLRAFAARCDVLTFDHELVDAEALDQLQRSGHAIRPSATTVRLAQDKRRQRAEFSQLGLPVPVYREIERWSDLDAFGQEQGWPVVAKVGRGGYDGRGVWVLRDQEEAATLAASLADREITLLVERWVPIERELATLVARRPSGEMVVYPIVETVQRHGMCHEVVAPAPISAAVSAKAERLARTVAESSGLVGMLALELFLTGDQIVINEIAARPHNSGHLTIEGAETSQFEQHLRAVLDWPLGRTALTAPAVAMVNVIGADASDSGDPAARRHEALTIPGVHLHLYGKAYRAGRKLGHVTALGETIDEARDRARRAASALAGESIQGMSA